MYVCICTYTKCVHVHISMHINVSRHVKYRKGSIGLYVRLGQVFNRENADRIETDRAVAMETIGIIILTSWEEERETRVVNEANHVSPLYFACLCTFASHNEYLEENTGFVTVGF